MKRLLYNLLLLVVCMLGVIKESKATHLYGGELFYTYVSGSTYRVTMILYGDCAGSASAFSGLYTATPEIQIYNGTTLSQTILLSIQSGSGNEVTPVCPSALGSTTCNGGTVPGIKRFSYSNTVTLGSSANWKFRFTGDFKNSTLAGRSGSITNITGSSLMSLEATLNNTVAPNSNPSYTTIPTPFFCINVAQEYNQGAVDPNTGDSLDYSLVPGLDANTTPSTNVTYVSPYTAASPLASASGTFSFNRSTGQLTFTPNLVQRSLVVCKVSEYRDGVLVGTSMREMTFVVISSCSNRSPFGNVSSVGGGSSTGNTSVFICKNNNYLSFDINPVDSDGNSITVTYAGLPAGATMTVTGSGTTTPKASFGWDITSVSPGTYYFFMTYQDDGCPLSSRQTIAYTIVVAPKPSMAYSLLSAATCTKKARFSVTPSGVSPFQLRALSGMSVVHTISGITGSVTDSLSPGIYTLRVIGGNGCFYDTIVTIQSPPAILPSVAVVNPLCHAGKDGSATVTASGGPAPYLFAIGSGLYSGANIFTGLSVGTYTIRVKDANECTKDTTITVSQPPRIVPAVAVKKSICKQVNDGALTVTATGGTGAYEYALGGGPYSTSNVFGSLYSGSYTVHIRDANNCIMDTTVAVGDSTRISTSFVYDMVSCNGLSDGTVTLLPVNGRAPYSFALGAGSYGTFNTFSGLGAGTYDFRIKDTLGCLLDTSATITQPSVLGISFGVNQPSCNGYADGVITIIGSGGTPAYQYALDPTVYKTSSVFTGIKAGTYTIHVKDYNNCLKDTVIVVGEPDPLIFLSVVTTPVSCYGDSNGSVSITAAGGTPFYTYAYDLSAFQADNLLTGMKAGTHTIRVKDSKGCEKDTLLLVTQPARLLFDQVIREMPTCEGYKDGSITLSGKGGTPAYQYAINGGAWNAPGAFTSLGEGNFKITVRDKNGCVYDSSTVLTGYPHIVVDDVFVQGPSCFGLSDGMFKVVASGGNPRLIYQIASVSGKTDDGYFGNRSAGTYTVLITDSTDCRKEVEVTVTQPDKIVINPLIANNDCLGLDTNGAIRLQVAGGTAPYSYAWNTGNTGNEGVISGLSNGKYFVVVTDSKDCSDSTWAEVAYDNCCTPLVANAFTPNADGLNDIIHVKFKGDMQLKEFSIYNRYGQQVFTTNNIDKGWDGTWGGQPAELGVYYYYARIICGSQMPREMDFKGDITLIR